MNELDKEVARRVRQGWRVAHQSERGVQMVRPRRFPIGGLVLFVIPGIGCGALLDLWLGYAFALVMLVVTLLVYAAKRDELAFLALDEAGAVTVQS